MEKLSLTKLRNDSEEATSVVKAVMMQLKRMLDPEAGGLTGALYFYDLNELCRDPSYIKEVFPNSRKYLEDNGLLQPDGSVHESVRNIVLSAVSGRGLDLQLNDPRAE